MNMQGIEMLADELAEALKEEWHAKVKAETARTTVEILQAKLLVNAYAEGVIDGKNADIRRRQETVALWGDSGYSEAMGFLDIAEHLAGVAEIERKRVEAVISLTRAWLYSQRPTP